MNENNVYQIIREQINRHDFDVENPLLILGRRNRKGEINGGTYPIQPTLASRLRRVAIDAVERIDRVEMSNYDGATILDPESGVWVRADQFQPDSPIMLFLSQIGEGDARLTAEEARSSSLSFYAIAFGTEENRVYFVREKAQRINAEAKIYVLIEQAMSLVEAPIISLDMGIDFILVDGGAAVFSAHAFEAYIQEPQDINRHVDESIGQLSEAIALGPRARAALVARGRDSLMTRGRIRSILARPYLQNLTLERVSEKIQAKRLDPNDYISGDTLDFDSEHTMFMLKLLDQKVWLGDFDDALYSTNAATQERP